jgi:hypothetical protein
MRKRLTLKFSLFMLPFLLTAVTFAAVTYSTTVKNTRMQAVVDAIGTAGKVEIGTAGMSTVLAVLPLANPAGAVSNGVLTFTCPCTDTSADASGTAAAARVRTSGDVDIITGLTVGTSGTDITLNNTSITSGQQVTLNSFTITHN